MTEPKIITDWLHIDGLDLYYPDGRGKGSGRKYCDDLVAAINRHPDRRAEVKQHKTRRLCRVVDYSEPVKCKSYHSATEFNIIVGWEPMEGHLER